MASLRNTGIGQPVRRREDFRLLTGKGCYSDDYNLPGQAYAVMVRAPHAHARIRATETKAAKAAPSVLAVLTGRDLVDDGLGAIPHSVGTRHPADVTLANEDGSPLFIPPHFPMATTEAHHCGEVVAMVVGKSLAAAKDGAELVAVDYEPLPAVAHSIAAVAPGAPLARTDGRRNVSVDAGLGDKPATDSAFATATHVVKFTTWIPRIVGVPMEPRAAIGAYEPESGRYTLYAGMGGAVRPKQDLAKILGVPEDKVRVVVQEVGGNFGTRGGFNPEFALVAWAARRVGRPVKWTCERSEAFVCDYQARDLAVEAELALDRDGNFLAMRGCNTSNVGAYPISYGPLAKGVEIMSSIYHVPAVHFRARAAITNTLPTRPYRSSGRPEVMFVVERLIDLAARQCGFDRLELRRRNLVP